MNTPPTYHNGAYGPVTDNPSPAAFAAGQGVVAKQNAEAQAQSDLQAKNLADSQSRMLGVAKSNAEMMHLYAATMNDMGKSAQQQVDNFAPTLKIAIDHDENLQKGDSPAVLGSHLTMDEALKHPEFKGAMLKHSIIPDGIAYVDDSQGHMMPTQTWTIIDPNVKVSLSPEAVNVVSQINPQWKDVFDATNGNMQIQLGKIQQVTQQVNSVQHAERLFTDAANSDDKMIQGLGLKGDISGEIMSAVKQGNPGARQALQALMAMENAGASSGTLADALNRLIHDTDHAAGARYILDALGTTPEKADKYIHDVQNEQTRQQALAKEGGIGDKAPAPASMIADLTAAAKKLHPDQAQAIMAGINPIGLTVGEAEKIKNNILQAQNSNVTNAQPTAAGPTPTGFVFNPDAPTMDSPTLRTNLQKQGVKLPANFEALYGIAHNANPLTTLPPNPRKGSNQMSAQEGLAFIRQYINPNYQEGDYAAAASLSKELASTRQGTAGGTLYNAGTASQHLELLDEAAKALNNNDTQALNHLANTFGVAVGKSPAVTFKAIAEQVNGEVGKVVAGGTPHEAELAELRGNLNSDQSPEQTKNVIRAYVKLMAGRISEINDRSQQYFNRDVKGVSPTTVKVFNKYGVPAPGQVAATVNGVTGFIPQNQVKAFQAKYPNATIGGQ
jgi:hypothetical protein